MITDSYDLDIKTVILIFTRHDFPAGVRLLLSLASYAPIGYPIRLHLCATHFIILGMSCICYKLMLCRQHDCVTGEHQERCSVEHDPISPVPPHFAVIYNRKK